MTHRDAAGARLEPGSYRDFMSSFPSGVAVVASADEHGRPFGFTCSSLCSVTLEPPTLLICVRSDSGTLAALRARGAFTVNLLHADGWPAASALASGRANRFDHLHWESRGRLRLPHLVADAHSVAECRVARTTVVGDHTVVFGEVASVTCGPGTPLLYGFRSFAAWTTPAAPDDLEVASSGSGER